jgi:hypothetical protein
MFASSSGSLAKRRGIVLVVVLGMLGLMALIGVTFATFAGQSLIGSRNFNQGVARPQAEVLMDYALAQLINDTNNPISALRGHSLLRDMYGNDSVFRGANPSANPASETGGVLTNVYSTGLATYVPIKLTSYMPRSGSNSVSPTPFYNQIQFQTNIPTTGQYYGLDFTRWIVKIAGQPANGGSNTPNNIPVSGFAAQTFEILEDDTNNNTGFHRFTFANNLTNPTIDPRYPSNTNQPFVPTDWATFLYVDPNYMSTATNQGYGVTPFMGPGPYSFVKATSSLAEEWNTNGPANNPLYITLDGRNMRAFNGPGLTQLYGSPATQPSLLNLPPYNLAALANFRVTNFNPDTQGMDEDYDACDLENWFLAIQSADGQVVVPSFHRPGILTGASAPLSVNAFGYNIPNDWTLNPPTPTSAGGNPKILRPRLIDNSPLFPPDPSTPDPATGKLTYDIDNDGDGVTDSVWLDLGYSIQRDPVGKLYKPLFAFMVIGLNGRLPLNTVGNLHARATADQANNGLAGPNPANNTTMPPSNYINFPETTGQVPYPGVTGDLSNAQNGYYYKAAPVNAVFAALGSSPFVSSQTYYDQPLYDHASHLGFSVNEINPKFALQNAPSNVYPSLASGIVANVQGNNYSQVDNAGVSVALTQMRNILAGTIPTDMAFPYTGTYPITAQNAVSAKGTPSQNGDVNVVMVNGQYMVLPNNMADGFDISSATGAVPRNLPAIAGRWGEPSGILQNSLMPPAGSVYPFPPYNVALPAGAGLSYPSLIYNNPVRAGRSFYVHGNNTNDIMDDDFDGTDPVLFQYLQQAQLYYHQPLAAGGTYGNNQPYNSWLINQRIWPEQVDNFDTVGQRSVAAERHRHYVTPHDPTGVGRVVDFMSVQSTPNTPNRPHNDYDFGNGYDSRGRTSYFRYFRAAGMPQDIQFPYGGVGASWSYPYPQQWSYNGQRFLMPQLFPAGSYYAAYPPAPYPVTGASDIHSNRYHGFQSMLTPEITYTNTGANPNLNGVTPQTVSIMASMPYDWDSSLNPTGAATPQGDIPAGYPIGQASTPIVTITGPPNLTGISLGANFVNNFAPMLNPYLPYSLNSPVYTPPQQYLNNLLTTSVTTSSGPNFGLYGNPNYVPTGTAPYPSPLVYVGYSGDTQATDTQAYFAPTVNGYLGGALNKDEADEMNLYTPNRYDMPYGPSDLEWLYRLQDVDGATLTSRLSQLAPVSFLNPADGMTRRRLFSTDSWEPTGWVYANDNPSPYAGAAYGASTDHTFTFNSRFTPTASPSLETMNQIDGGVVFPNGYAGIPTYSGNMANPITTGYLPNPTFPTLSSPIFPTPATSFGTSYGTVIPNSGLAASTLPVQLDTGSQNLFDQLTNYLPIVGTGAGVVVNYGKNSMVQVQTPALAHRDRRINLNIPLPISSDPAEPVRQKWCRETYTLLKAILPPSSVDTPEELAALSQFVVNIIDFRDTDCAMTRFVNTDLIVTDVLTKTASNVQPSATTNPVANMNFYDTTWNVSPAGVRFANALDAGNLTTTVTPPTALGGNAVTITHFPYDPTIYNPDTTTPFLVQHGMEYSPIAINEILGVQFQYGTSTSTTASTPLTTGKGLFIELVNTLTEEQNNNGLASNASAIPLTGWDLIIAPDNYGWGRPDPISGDVSSIAYPPKGLNNPMSTMAIEPAANAVPPLSDVNQFSLSGTVLAINSNTPKYLVVGTNLTGTPFRATSGTGANKLNTPDVTLPAAFLPASLPMAGSGLAKYYWVYLRRPANPFDTAALVTDSTQTTYRPNREMVVVDAMRFPFIDQGTITDGVNTVTVPTGLNAIYSARRLQPYRGGHLTTVATPAGTGATTIADGMTDSVANGVTAICPPTPAYAYGYSEQTSPATGGTVTGSYQPMPTATATTQATTNIIQSSIGSEGTPVDKPWANMPFNDRDFTSVAELLLVPGCPPGLFTKQFIEDPYPGNIATQIVTTTQTTPTSQANVTTTTTVQYMAPYATGTDNTTFASPIVVPTVSNTPMPVTTGGGTAPTVVTTTTTSKPIGGRQNFNELGVANDNSTPVAPTFPYLPDNFYYTAASVAPPSTNFPQYYQYLTTEVGGWTGNGWHKMLEFFEVPSSANGAIGTADTGFNFDWARADIKPGLLNLNLIIDEEVFAGLFDDPRLNERLAAYAPAGGSSAIPHIVTQIDGNGYAAAQYAIFGSQSVNVLNLSNTTPPVLDTSYYPNNNPQPYTAYAGRGYSVRDPDAQNYVPVAAPMPFPYQQLHGMKAAFSDFLKLRHGGSGFLFAHGAGPTGSGDQVHNGAWPVTQPIASDRPYRSLSYPDINYTVMRPASLPPSVADLVGLSNGGNFRWTATSPSLPANQGSPNTLLNLFSYFTNTPNLPAMNANTYVQLFEAVAPMNLTLEGIANATSYQYVADPGVKNPYLSVQYINQAVPNTGAATANAPPTIGLGGPPYPALQFTTLFTAYPASTQPYQPFATTATPAPFQPAPFPPSIPPTPAARLIQIPDIDTSAANYPAFPSSNATVLGQLDGTAPFTDPVTMVTTPPLPQQGPTNVTFTPGQGNWAVNVPVSTLMTYSGGINPPTLVAPTRAVFAPDNNTPQNSTTFAPLTAPNQTTTLMSPYAYPAAANNFLGSGRVPVVNATSGVVTYVTADYRQNPLYRTEWLQKIMNLTTVRTHQFAVWITVGFFEVVKTGTPELGVPDVLGQELGLTAGKNTRYRSFFTLDRTKATGFNPYYPGNFRDCVTYRRRIE